MRWLLPLLLLLGCTQKADPAPGPPPRPASTASAKDERGQVLLDWLKLGSECSLGHRGAVVDFGDATMRRPRVRGGKDAHVEAVAVEHQGATWTRVTGREVMVPFSGPLEVPEAGQPLAVSVRARGGAAKSMSLYLNGKPLGPVRLAKNVTGVVSLKTTTAALLAGENELSIRFNGQGRGSDVAAEIDWVRIGPYDDDEPYAAPTRADAIDTVKIGAEPRRALSIRGPGYARCAAYLPKGARLSAALGILGTGEADVEVRVLRDRKAAFVASSLHLNADSAWRPLDVDLGELDTIAEVELVAVHTTKGSRVVFAEPRVSVAAPIHAGKPMPTAKSAVLVVLGSLAPRSISVYGGPMEMPELGAVAANGVVFDAHRTTSAVSAGAMASLLTGVEADEHGVVDGLTKLPTSLTTVADCARQGGVQTAMFTANPNTTAAFGFDRGFSTFGYADPTDASPSTRVFDDAADWVTAHRESRFLLVIHARGGHPPWDATREQLKEMPPASYAGTIEPRHAGEVLGRIRGAKGARFTDADRVRMWALHSLALSAHDAALGRLLNTLRSLHRDEDTAVFVTSDVGLDDGARVPFGEGDSLNEESLASALLIRPPAGQTIEAARVGAPTSSVDVAATVLASLGLAAPTAFQGVDLWSLSTGSRSAEMRRRIAWAGNRFSLTWANFLLLGGVGGDAGSTRLCDLKLEPACTTDVRATYPIAYARIASLVDERTRGEKRPPREPANVDFATNNALRIWGRNVGGQP